jgi:hypothetical protein
MAVKIDTLETVCRRIWPLQRGLAEKPTFFKMASFGQRQHDAQSATTSCVTAQSAWTS